MIIGWLKERITGGGRPKISRAQVLAARPLRNPSVQWTREAARGAEEPEEAPRVVLLRIPRRRDRWGNLAATIFRLPDFRKVELDEIGSDVWEMCDGTRDVEALTRAVCASYRLNRRQGEASVTAYLRMLAERRLVALRTGGKGAGAAASAAKEQSGGGGKGRAAARGVSRRRKQA